MIRYVEKSVHTLELMAEVRGEEVSIIYDMFKDMRSSIRKEVSGTEMLISTSYIFSRFGDTLPGINSITLIINRDNYTTCIVNAFLHVIINPAKAFSNTEWGINADVVPRDELCHAYDVCCLSLKEHLGNEIMQRMKFNRIDFCCNMRFDSQEDAEEFLGILRKGVPPKALEKIVVYEEAKKEICTGILLTCGSYEIAAYLKQKEMLGRRIRPIDLQEASGVLRIELRALSSKLKSIISRDDAAGLQDISSERLGYLTELGVMEMKKKLCVIVGKGRFRRYDETALFIEKANIRDKDKREMMDVVYYLARHPKGGDLLKDKMWDMQKWKKLLRKFDEIGCSPITLPRTSGECTYPGMERIFDRRPLLSY